MEILSGLNRIKPEKTSASRLNDSSKTGHNRFKKINSRHAAAAARGGVAAAC